MARRAGSDGARTEAAIRAAALHLIAHLGYEALSMRRLAQEVGLAPGALYRYFPNKQAILYRLLERHMEELFEAWSRARPRTGLDPVARLEAFTRFHVRHHLPRGEGVFLSYMELRSLTRANFEAIQRMRRAYEGELVEILEAGRAAGRLDVAQPRIAARAIIAMLTGITTWYRDHGPLGPDEIADIYWTMVARLAGARTAALKGETA